jgi:hypothetical protein
MVMSNLETAKLNDKRNYNRAVHMPDFAVGRMVLVEDESASRGRSKKLEPAYVRPYEIKRIEGSNLILRTRHSK